MLTAVLLIILEVNEMKEEIKEALRLWKENPEHRTEAMEILNGNRSAEQPGQRHEAQE